MKKRIPLALRELLEKITKEHEELFLVQQPENSIIKFLDVDLDSDFSFEINKINPAAVETETSYTVKLKPWSENSMNQKIINLKLQSLGDYFKKWLTLLEKFNKKSVLFDDIFIQKYYEDLEPRFEILEKNISRSPYSIGEQKTIVKFLENTQEILNCQNDDDSLIVETSELIQSTKQRISKLTKEKVIVNIRKIMARGFKIGLDVGEKLLIEFTTELVKKITYGN